MKLPELWQYAMEKRLVSLSEFNLRYKQIPDCQGPKITWFTFDENFLSLKNRGTIQLHTWYETPVRFDTMCFMAGSTELCLIDSAGCARVLSLVSEQFGYVSIVRFATSH